MKNNRGNDVDAELKTELENMEYRITENVNRHVKDTIDDNYKQFEDKVLPLINKDLGYINEHFKRHDKTLDEHEQEIRKVDKKITAAKESTLKIIKEDKRWIYQSIFVALGFIGSVIAILIKFT